MEGKHIFLLVALEKAGMPEDHRYEDRFLTPDLFQRQSQNRTKRDSAHGKMIREHASRGIAVHLFVRRAGKVDGRAAPFIYVGDVDFLDWEGEAPITVKWKLREAVPGRVAPQLELYSPASET